jgi:hypothetical protein
MDFLCSSHGCIYIKVKVIPQQAEVAHGGPYRFRPQIFLTFSTARVVGRQPYTPTAFTPGEIPGTHFQGLSRPQGTWFCWREPRKKSPVAPSGIDPGTIWLVVQCLNHYAPPGPKKSKWKCDFGGEIRHLKLRHTLNMLDCFYNYCHTHM